MSTLIILLHRKLATILGSQSFSLSCLRFHDFVWTFLVPLFPFGSVSFPLLTGLRLKFIVADLVLALIFFLFFSWLPLLRNNHADLPLALVVS